MKYAFALAVLSGLGAVVGTVWIGGLVAEPTVVERPYESALAWDDDKHAHESAGWQATLVGGRWQTPRVDLEIALRDNANAPLRGADIKVALSRPGGAAEPPWVNATATPSGTFVAPLQVSETGGWEAHIEVALGNQRLRFRRQLVVEGEAE